MAALEEPPAWPTAGQLNSELASAVVQVHSRYVGRGPTRAQAFYRRNVVVVVMEDAMTKGEQSLVAGGRTELALHVRREYQETMREELVRAVESLTGCRVIAFLSSNHVDPDLSAELFVLDRAIQS